MKLLILGKNSYVGTSVKKYIEKKYPEAQVDLKSSRNNEWGFTNFGVYDAVYNVSGLCHADSKHGTPAMYMEINAELPFEMATKAKKDGVPLFINMSSTIIYGNMSRMGEDKIIDKYTEPTPVNIYGKSKLEAEKKLRQLEDENFKVAIIRAPLIYGEEARDNFPRLVKFAKTMPFFPNIQNNQSMIYIDNFCELIHLVIKHQQGGIYMPQDAQYICTSKLVKDIADACGRKLILTSVFNPILRLLSKKVYLINKVFGNVVYAQEASNHFDYEYRAVDYKTAIGRITN